MNNNYLLSLVSSAVPLLAIGFVALLLIYKIYIKIRSKFNTAVNCWFCNQNARVPYLEANSWTCPHCEQYNGFTKDGDYNREMYQQLDCSNLSSSGTKSICQSDHSSPRRPLLPPRNGFCEGCNEAQRLKVEKLAQFEPKNESHFDEELKVYKAKLEEQYRLCSTCDRHLGKVLREKKKMVLGSKFLDFIIKGAETLKQPHFNQLRFVRQQHWKQRFARCTTLLAIGNIVCLLCVLPTLKRETLTNILGEILGTQLFIGCSHLLALSKVLGAYVETAAAQPLLIKSALFMRTLFMMLLYSLGLKWPQIVSFHFGSLYLLVGPFGLLACAFAYNVFDGFRLNRFTFLLALWSAFAAGLFDEERVSVWISKEALMLIYSVCTLLLSLSSKHETTAKLHDDTAHSFHKLYSEDYFSDDETMSMLSHQLNSSAVSMRSTGSSCSPRSINAAATAPSTTTHYAELHKSPSLRSLNLPRNTQLSPNSSFRSFCLDDNQSLLRSPHYAASLCNFPTSVPPPMVRSPLFASSQELSCGGGISINDTLTNGSFLPPLSQLQRKSDESLWRGSSGYNNQQQHHAFSTAYSASNNAVHQQRAHSLITPSRFSNDCLASNASAASWLSGGYFNQRHPLTNQQQQQQLLLQQQPRNGMSVIAESLSRASSHSSGFESQHERPCASRENSYGPEPLDVLQRTICADDARGFMPIDGSCYSPRASLLSQPLTVNCATTAAPPQQHDLWPRAPVMRENGFGAGRDSFNLRQINAELPSIRRGDLLKKWKQGQAST